MMVTRYCKYLMWLAADKEKNNSTKELQGENVQRKDLEDTDVSIQIFFLTLTRIDSGGCFGCQQPQET